MDNDASPEQMAAAKQELATAEQGLVAAEQGLAAVEQETGKGQAWAETAPVAQKGH